MEAKKGSLKSTIAVSLTNYLDAGSIVAGASGLTLWKNYLSLQDIHLSWLNAISANCFGAAIGAIIGGFLADKFGRKTIYTYNMLVYMTGVAIIMLSVSFPMLLLGFLITGISVGAGVPASWTYISETSEVSNRGRNIGISQFAWSIGPAIIFLLGMLLAKDGVLGKFIYEKLISIGWTPQSAELFGNRIIFGTLFVVALIAWLLQRQLDESKDWENSKSQQKQSSRQTGVFSSFGALFKNVVNVRTIIYLAGIYLTWNLVAGVMGFFMPHVYETAGGVTNEYANRLQTVMWGLTALVSFFGFALLSDKVNQRLLYIGGTLLGVLAWVVLTFIGITNGTALWIFVILWGVHAGFGVQAFYALWASELFPAKYRAAAQGIMFFIVRGVAGIWSFIFIGVFDKSGFYTSGVIMVILLAIVLIVGAIWTPKTQGKSLKEITKERYGDQ
ncbi:MAG: MFS transporter [Dysgonamonadaceae bacterium]|jgi:inositol transporter-like SP family MFS transporter|nr:MFS transporter [Dysgonamonadaceae bacterium]